MQHRIMKLVCSIRSLVLLIGFLLPVQSTNAQDRIPITFGIHLNPTLQIPGKNGALTETNGNKAGFNYGFDIHYQWKAQMAFTAGIHHALNRVDVDFNINQGPYAELDYDVRFQQIRIPLGFKLQTKQLGYMQYYVHGFLNPSFTVQERIADSTNILSDHRPKGDSKIIRPANMGFGFGVGCDYEMLPRRFISVGVRYENSLVNHFRKTGQFQEFLSGNRVSMHYLSLFLGFRF